MHRQRHRTWPPTSGGLSCRGPPLRPCATHDHLPTEVPGCLLWSMPAIQSVATFSGLLLRRLVFGARQQTAESLWNRLFKDLGSEETEVLIQIIVIWDSRRGGRNKVLLFPRNGRILSLCLGERLIKIGQGDGPPAAVGCARDGFPCRLQGIERRCIGPVSLRAPARPSEVHGYRMRLLAVAEPAKIVGTAHALVPLRLMPKVNRPNGTFGRGRSSTAKGAGELHQKLMPGHADVTKTSISLMSSWIISRSGTRGTPQALTRFNAPPTFLACFPGHSCRSRERWIQSSGP